jgi:hypothetical protein
MLLFWDPCDLYNSTARFEAGGWTDNSSAGASVDFNLAGGRFGGGALIIDPSVNETVRADVPVSITNSRIYVSFAWWSLTNTATDSFMEFYNNGGSDLAVEIRKNPDRSFQIRDADGSVVFNTAPGSWLSGIWHRIEILIDVAGGTSGQVQIRVDGTVVYNSSTDNPPGIKTTDGATDITLVRWVGGSSDPEFRIDDVVIWDDEPETDSPWIDAFIGDFFMVSDVPDGNSVDEQVKSAAVAPETLLDDPAPGDHDADGTYIETNPVGTNDTRVSYPTLPGNVGTVLGVGVMSEMKKTTGGGFSLPIIRLRVHSAAAIAQLEDVSSLSAKLSTEYTVLRGMAYHDPNISDDWVKSTAEAAEVGLNSSSTA